jgi:adenylate cyclase
VSEQAPVQRRLAAILAGDVVGYSRLMGADEVGTLNALKAARHELTDAAIAAHHGRIVKTTGDGILIEFAGVVDAVACAVTVQEGMAARNADVPEDKRIIFRIGINIGDIIIDEADIHGDGVNVAARLEGLAQPGGICISGAAYEQVRGKLDVAFEDMGEQSLKNIERPVRVYRVAIGIVGANTSLSSSAERTTLPLPDRPSIAVLPFQNMSGDPEQEYFADGMVEDVITALSHIRWLFVIARNSSFTYKGRDRREASRTRAWCALRPRGQRSQSGRSAAHHGTADRRYDWRASLGRPLRSRPGRHLRPPGRDHRNGRFSHRAHARSSGAAAGVA